MMLPISSRLHPLSRLSAPMQVVEQFTPNWFTVTMGTGIIALALNQVPGNSAWLHATGRSLWLADIGLFILFTLLYLARWVFFFQGARRIFRHPVMSMFLGAIPMGLATIVNGFVAFGPDLFGAASFSIAQALWWLDAVLAIGSGVLIPFLMFTRQTHAVDTMTAIWLLPVVAAEVTAASGAQLIPHLSDPQAAFRLLILNYALRAFSVPLARCRVWCCTSCLITAWLASSWLALGPIGTGALGLLLGRDAATVCAAVGVPTLGPVAEGVGVLGDAILWGYGVWRLPLLITAHHLRDLISFNIGC